MNQTLVFVFVCHFASDTDPVSQTLIYVFMCQLISDIDPCEPNPCHNGGLCVPTNGTFTCQCAEGYTGDKCEIGMGNRSM